LGMRDDVAFRANLMHPVVNSISRTMANRLQEVFFMCQ
jgi:hypothetical protein